MIYQTGNLLEQIQSYNYILCTTNSFIKKDESLVMGRGFAKDIRDMYNGIDGIFGNLISSTCGHLERYGVLFYGHLGIFQVKYGYMNSADIELVKYSTEMLINIANRQPNKLFGMNCPAIGNGKMHITIVDPIISELPDNVHIWRK